MGTKKWNNVTNEELTQIVKEKYLNGELNRYKNLGTKTNTPDFSVLQRRFNIQTWSEFLFFIKVKEEELTREEKIQCSINEIKDLAENLGKCPKVKDYKTNRKNGYDINALQINTGLKYNEFCRKYLPQYEINNDRDLSKGEIIEFLTNLKSELGRTPKLIELTKYGFDYDVSIINRKFNMTYNELVRSLNWKIEGWKPNINTEEELLNFFNELYLQNMRIPTAIELQEIVGGVKLYIKKFGSVYNVCQMLNISCDETNISQNRMGRVCFDKEHKKCNSLKECDISNLLIDNNIKNDKEIAYSDLIKNGHNRRFDWRVELDGFYYYIEYAGMYVEKQNGKISILYKDKVHNKIKDLKKENKLDRVLFIYPEDDYKEKIEQFLNIKLNTDVLYKLKQTVYSKLSELDLSNLVISYSKNDIIPSEEFLKEQNSELLYEIHLRYKHYFDFCEKNNLKKNFRYRYRNYWNEEQIFNKFKFMMNKYNYILTTEEMRYCEDECLRGLYKILSTDKYRLIKMRLKFWEKYINEFQLTNKEITWLEKVRDNKGTGVKNKVSEEQQGLAKNILSINNM